MASSSDSMKILITVHGDAVASRFDLCAEVMIAEAAGGALIGEPRTMLLSGASADEICGIAIKEDVSALITGGMEEEHYEYLQWKKIKVIDRVVGRAEDALMLFMSGGLSGGAILKDKADSGDAG